MAVVQDAGLGRATVVGHSLGGLVTLHVASRFGRQLAGAVAIDCPVGEASPADRAAAQRRAYAPAHVHEDRRALAARFRPLPDQEMLPYVRNHIAETSIRAADGGWSWKFDPAVFRNDIELPEFTSPGCPVVLVRAEHGMLTAPLAAGIVDRLERPVPVVSPPAETHGSATTRSGVDVVEDHGESYGRSGHTFRYVIAVRHALATRACADRCAAGRPESAGRASRRGSGSGGRAAVVARR